MQTKSRPKLAEVPLSTVWPPRPGQLTVTMSQGQWDAALEDAYESGFTLIEVDARERPRRAYRSPTRN